MSTNLPSVDPQDSAAATKLFFDIYGQSPLEFNATDVDAALGFFLQNGFDQTAAIISSAALLKQAKVERLNIFDILDTLGSNGTVKLSAVVSEILNNDRPASSIIGYRDQTITRNDISRNVGA
jgi:hypothetical protein